LGLDASIACRAGEAKREPLSGAWRRSTPWRSGSPGGPCTIRQPHDVVMTANKALEFKGRMLSLTRARILDPDPTAISTQLQEFARQMPQAVKGMPVVLEADNAVPLGGVIAAMRSIGMQPLGVADGPLAA